MSSKKEEIKIISPSPYPYRFRSFCIFCKAHPLWILRKGLSGNDSDKKAKFQLRGFYAPKIDSIIEKQNILTKSQSQNALYLSGCFYFVLWEVKLLISRQPRSEFRSRICRDFYCPCCDKSGTCSFTYLSCRIKA